MSTSNSDWAVATDPKSGRQYWYNRVTKVTTWQNPMETTQQPTVATPTAAATPAATASDDPNDVAANWAESTDPKTGRKYYYNRVTKKTQWTAPACLDGGAADRTASPSVAAAAANLSATLSVSSPATPSAAATPAPAAAATAAPGSDWAEAKDPKSGRTYWYNRVTKVTTWQNPNEMSSAAARMKSLRDDDDNVTQSSQDDGPAMTAAERLRMEAAHGADEPQAKSDIRSLLRDENSDDEDEGKSGDMGAVKKAQSDKLIGENRKRLEEDDAADGDQTEFRFAKHRHGWFNRLFRTGQVFDDAKLLTWKKSMIKKALLKQNRDLDEEAVQAFKNIMSYMGDRKSSKEPIDHAKKLLRNLMTAPSGLRDEVYMQLVKQTTGNPRVESNIRGWELFSFFLATFPPSKSLRTFLTEHITKTASDPTASPRVQEFARLALERLPKIVVMGQRKQVPSALELQCLMESKPIPIHVMLVNGTHKALTVDPYMLVREVEEMMVQKLGITVTAPFSLYEQAEINVERILDSKDRILDVAASWENLPLIEEEEVEQEKKAKTALDKNFQESKVAAPTAKPKYNKFIFKAKLVLKTTNKELMTDAEAINLVYMQAVSDVVSQRYPCNEKDLTVLAALQLQNQHGDYKREVHVPGWLKPNIQDVMPRSILEKKGGKLNDALVNEWEQKILAKYAKVSGFSPIEARLNYLDYVQEWVFYGATFFTVEQRQFKDYPSPLTLGINCEGVILMHPEKRTVLESYAFTDIVTWGHSDEKLIIVVGNIVQQRKLIFKTDEGKVMNSLIHDYVRYKVKSKASEAQTQPVG